MKSNVRISFNALFWSSLRSFAANPSAGFKRRGVGAEPPKNPNENLASKTGGSGQPRKRERSKLQILNSTHQEPRYTSASMGKPFFDAKWIRVGFNFGIGFFLAILAGYSILMLGLAGIVALFGTAKVAGPGVFSFSVVILGVFGALFLLIVIPALVGKTIAQFINFIRFRKFATAQKLENKNV